jgi:hypothetical protein
MENNQLFTSDIEITKDWRIFPSFTSITFTFIELRPLKLKIFS